MKTRLAALPDGFASGLRLVCGIGFFAGSNLFAGAALAQDAAQAPAAAGEAGTPEPKVVQSTIEDDNIRIDELRVRGESRRLVVSQKKGGLPSYEIVPLEGSRDTSQRTKGAVGQRVWQVLSF